MKRILSVKVTKIRRLLVSCFSAGLLLFGAEATSALASVHAYPIFKSNWNLEMLVFQERGNPEDPEKNPRIKARTNNKLNPRMAPGRNRTRATLVGGEQSRHCAIHALEVCQNKIQKFIISLQQNYFPFELSNPYPFSSTFLVRVPSLSVA